MNKTASELSKSGYLLLREAAARYRTTEKHLKRLIRRGEFPQVLRASGGLWLVPVDALLLWETARLVGPKQQSASTEIPLGLRRPRQAD